MQSLCVSSVVVYITTTSRIVWIRVVIARTITMQVVVVSSIMLCVHYLVELLFVLFKKVFMCSIVVLHDAEFKFTSTRYLYIDIDYIRHRIY